MGDSRWMTLFFGLTAYAIGEGVQASNGNLSPASIIWLTVALVSALLGSTLRREPTGVVPAIVERVALGLTGVTVAWYLARGALTDGAAIGLALVVTACIVGVTLKRRPGQVTLERLTLSLVGLALAWQFWLLANAMPGIYLQLAGLQTLTPFYGSLAVAALVCGLAFSDEKPLATVTPVLMVGAFVMLGVWMIRTSPAPHIDVFVFQRDAAIELLAGRNPYAMQYPDIYGNSPFYGEGLSVNGRLQFGFPYFPLSLLLALPGHVALGDYRYAQVAASAIAMLLLMYTRPGPLPRVLAAVYLFTPRAFFVVEQGWTDPFVVFGLAAVIFCAVKYPRSLPYVLGAFLAIKQYLVFALPAALLLLPWPLERRRTLVFFAKALGVAAAITLPFFLWDPKAFWHDVVALQTLQPFRVESMSYLAWWHSQGHERPSTAWAFVMAIAALGLGLWRLPRTPAGFAACCTLAYVAFFGFNKQAFCNYYAFTIGAAVLAAGAVGGKDTTSAQA